MNEELLKEIGLTPGEIKVYTALLENDSSRTGKISKLSGVHTSKVYPILDRLIEKGLASYIIENNVKHYRATNPKQLISYIHKKKRILDEQEKELKNIIPEILLKQKKAKYKQSAYVYEGLKGITAIFEIMLDEWKSGEDYLVFAPGEEYKVKEINDFFKRHHPKRIEKGIVVKALALKNQKKFYKKTYENVKNMKIRYTNLSLPAGINIVGNKVVTLIWEPLPTAFVIDSEFLAERYRDFFNNVWKISK